MANVYFNDNNPFLIKLPSKNKIQRKLLCSYNYNHVSLIFYSSANAQLLLNLYYLLNLNVKSAAYLYLCDTCKSWSTVFHRRWSIPVCRRFLSRYHTRCYISRYILAKHLCRIQFLF